MRKFLVAVFIIGAFILYSFVYNANAVAVLPSSSNSTEPSTATSTGATPTASSAPGGPLYKNGSYTGSAADAQWGYVQVHVVIQNGKITNVQFLQYPNERNRSIAINNYADPQLVSEAIQAQNANVDIITGATDTSEAFIQSLSDALSQARA